MQKYGGGFSFKMENLSLVRSPNEEHIQTIHLLRIEIGKQ